MSELIHFPRHIILVHGAWQGAWAWDEVRTLWRDADVTLHAVDLPTARGGGDLYTDARAVVEFALSLQGGVSLFGHSYGGSVVTEASSRVPGLCAVGYLAAIRPAVGESTSDVTRRLGERTSLDDSITRIDDELELTAQAASSVFENPTGDPARRAMEKSHRQSVASLRQRVTQDLPSLVPTSYIVCCRDKAVSVLLQRATAATCASQEEIDEAHCPHIEHPEIINDVLERFAHSPEVRR